MTRRAPLTARAMTIIELLLALTMTAIIGGTVAMIMVVASYGTSTRAELRTVMVRGDTLDTRLAAVLRSAAMVLDHGADHLVLWTSDTDGGGNPHLSELARIEFDADSELITVYEAPADLSPASDTEYDLATANFDAVTGALAGGASFPGAVWGRGVTAWRSDLDHDTTRLARSVSFRFTIASGDTAEPIVGAAAMRN